MILPKGQTNNPEYYILGHSVSEEEEKSNNIFDVNSNRANSYLDSVLSSMNINELNCRYNKLIKYYVENTYEVSKNDYNKYIDEVLDDIIACNPKIIICFGSEVARILLGDRFRYMKSARGRLFDIDIKDHQFKVLVTYSPNYITKSPDNPEDYQDMTEYANAFYNDINYSARYVNGDLVDISNKDLRFAKTYDEFKEYFDQYLKDCEFPSYDIESNAKDPRCADFRIVGYSLAPNGNTGIYVIRKTLEYEMPEDDWQKCVEITKEYLMSRKCLVHNIMYEKPATLNEWNINIIDFEDSLIKARLLLGGKTGAGLKDQCILNLGYPEWDADLGSYITYFTQLWNDLYPTPAGNNRWDFNYLSEHGFRGLLNCYKEMDKITKELSNKNSDELSKDEEKALKDNYIDDRSRRCMNAMLDLIPLISTYYDENEIENILELVGKELINLIEIRYSGMLPYSSIPMKIITKYGAMDSVATHDLNAFLSKRMDNESTDTVNLWNGYRVAKEHFIVGSHLEMNGLYWNEEVAKSNYDWLASTAKESLRNCIMSGFLDDQIIDNSMYLLQDEVVNNRMEYVRSVLGDFEMQKSAIKLIATGKRISYKNLIWELPQEFIDSMKPWVLQKSKELIMDDTVHKSFEDLKYIFNPASNKNKDILDKILVTNEIQIGYIIVKVREEIEQESFTIESVPMSERILYSTIQNIDKYNKSDECTQKITQRQLFEKVDAVLPQITVKTPMNGYEGSKLYRIINEAMHYHLDGTSEPVMLKLFDYYEAIGIDTEDESTYTPEFEFFWNFRMYKKCTKLISSYIDGSKIGRGSVWTVDRKDIDDNKVEPIRRKKYDWYKEKSEDEEYILQPIWKVCFTGDTKVKSLDGNSYSFKELVNNNVEELWVYSCKENGEIVPALATNIRKTRTNAKLVKVTLDNGEEIKCTPDHPFMLRDGSYKEAKDLSVNDSLMPLYLEYDKNGYVLYADNISGKLKKVHSLVNKTINYEKYKEVYNNHDHNHEYLITHHKDRNKTNNLPDNLLWMTNKEHNRLHIYEYDQGLGKYVKSEENRQKSREKLNKWKKDNPEKVSEISRNNMIKLKADNPGMDAENGRKNITAYNKSDAHKERCRITSSRPEHVALFKKNSEKYRKTEAFHQHCIDQANNFLNTPENREKAAERFSNMNSDPDKRLLQVRGKIGKTIKWLIDNGLEFNKENYESNKQKRGIIYENIINYFDSYEDAYQFGLTYNHKVISIEYLNYTEDVYDLTVEEYHNFALDAGIFVHNCTAETLRWKAAVHTLPAGRIVKGMYTSRYKGGVIAAPDYCVVGESRIRLADNSTPMVKDLEGLDEFYTYSYDQDSGKVVIGHGHDCRIVKKVNKTYRIHTNDGSIVETSAEHRFWSNNINGWKQASELEVGESLKAYEIVRRDDPNPRLPKRLGVIQDDGYFSYTQQLADDYNIKYGIYQEKSYVRKNIHHIDFNPDNNNPWNIQPLESSDHGALHAREQWSNKERLYDGETYREKMIRIATDNFNSTRLEVNQNPEFIQRRKDGRLKTGFSRFEDGIKLMLENHSPREILLDYSYFSYYDDELLRLSSLNRIPKGMGARFILEQGISFYDYLITHQELWSNQVEDVESVISDLELINQINNSEKASYKEICWIKKLYRFMEDEGLPIDDWDNSYKELISRGVIGRYQGKHWNTVISIFESKENLDKYCKRNHYITKIEVIDYPKGIDLYSFTVDDYHNFLFDNGVLSHQSQLEVRITAGLSNCTPMLEAYKNGEDVHLRTACGIFKKKPEEITKVERRFSKMGCVVGSTRILMPNGCTPTIEEIYNSTYEYNPDILSYNLSDNKTEPDKIVGVQLTQYVSKTVRLYFDDNKYIECTSDHPMLLAMGSYKEAKNCGGYSIETTYYKKEDDIIKVAKRDKNLSRMIIKVEEVEYDDPIPVYDLAVVNNHNYPIFIDKLSENEYCAVYAHNTFRILYGSTPEGFASQFLDGDVALARSIFDGFYETYPEIKEYMDKRHAEVEKYGKISCEKVGYFLNIDVANDPEGIEGAYRKAGNYGIQSQGSMVGGYVLSSINNYFMSNNMYTKPISFIHDSLEFDIHPQELFKVAPVILRMMNDIPINEFGILTEADVTIGTSMGMENEIKKMEFSDDGNEGWLTLEGFEDDLDEMYNHWKYSAEYRLVEYEDIGDPEPVYTRKRELFQEKLALGPFLGKTRYLIKRKFHLVLS